MHLFQKDFFSLFLHYIALIRVTTPNETSYYALYRKIIRFRGGLIFVELMGISHLRVNILYKFMN